MSVPCSKSANNNNIQIWAFQKVVVFFFLNLIKDHSIDCDQADLGLNFSTSLIIPYAILALS